MIKLSWRWSLGFLALLILCGGLWTFFFRHTHDGQWHAVTRGTIIEAVYGIGTITPHNRYDLKLAIPATVDQLFVEEGQFVSKGQKLAQAGVVFSAPFSGTVTSVYMQKGETVSPQSPILTLVDMSSCYIAVNVEQQGAIKLKIGQACRLSFESMRDHPLGGRVKYIYARNGQFWVHVQCDSLPQRLLPGMTADVAIIFRQIPQAILVPLPAIQNGFVTRKRGRNTQRVQIQTGIIEGNYAQVIRGDLTLGDQVQTPRTTSPQK